MNNTRPLKTNSDEKSHEKHRNPQDLRKSFPIVGIGASAGGLEAFTLLLKALQPRLGMAFVLLPHLDPSRESSLTQILARETQMSVVEAENGMPVLPDHVYIIPPNCEITVSRAVLHLSDREAPRSVNLAIDIFLRSLAADQGNNAIGVVLSGTASDGTLGLAEIKGAGGITFAQDPKTAKYDSMPASAIAAGCVDFVLSPEGIAHELAGIRQHPYVAQPHTVEADVTAPGRDAVLVQIFRLLRRATKVDFSEYKPPTIERRIQRRMALHKIERLEDYAVFLQRDRNEVAALSQDLLINVTSFFRNPEAFDALKEIVYPTILEARRSSSSPIRIWVPGCSTGEETYSHAICLVEFLDDQRAEIPIQIFGTDLSANAIQRARSGFYKENIEADVSAERLRRFFHRSDSGYQISKTIRDMCIFSTQNVFSDPPFSRMDLVSCRNVMIYLSQSLQKRVIPIFHYALQSNGFLMIGSTEGLLGFGSDLFEMADKKQKIFSKKPGSIPITFGLSIGQSEPEIAGKEIVVPISKSSEGATATIELQREADRLLLTRYVPPAVVINDQLEVLQARGHTGAFLELPPGKVSLNVLKMARPGLLFELQGVIEEGQKTGLEARRENVRVGADGDETFVTLRVIPFAAPTQDQHSFLIVFEGSATGAGQGLSADPPPARTATEEQTAKQIAQLKQELAATKGYLQSIIETHESTNEELQSANEEIQSGNEELQSANEELQTSKEELESTNEELHTVNEEMQHRNDLLMQLNNDLINLLNSVDLPMVLLGADLSVRRFTPQAATVLGLMPSDVGRPMPRLKLRIDVGNLEQTMLDVIRDVQARQSRVQDQDGQWHSLRIAPYRTLDNRIDGVVLTMIGTGRTSITESEPNGPRSPRPRRKGPSKS